MKLIKTLKVVKYKYVYFNINKYLTDLKKNVLDLSNYFTLTL